MRRAKLSQLRGLRHTAVVIYDGEEFFTHRFMIFSEADGLP